MRISTYRRCMEEYLGRSLHRDEIVHHINGNHDDDRLENLRIVTPVEHRRLHPIDITTRARNPQQVAYNEKLNTEALSRFREVMRLKAMGLNVREMALILKVSEGRVKQLVKAAKRAQARGEF